MVQIANGKWLMAGSRGLWPLDLRCPRLDASNLPLSSTEPAASVCTAWFEYLLWPYDEYCVCILGTTVSVWRWPWSIFGMMSSQNWKMISVIYCPITEDKLNGVCCLQHPPPPNPKRSPFPPNKFVLFHQTTIQSPTKQYYLFFENQICRFIQLDWTLKFNLRIEVSKSLIELIQRICRFFFVLWMNRY